MDDFERRLKRAKLHLNHLNVQVEKFRGREPFTTERGRDLKGGGYVLRVASHKPIPPNLGLIAADFVHNLRALLDNLTWSVASAALKRNRNLSFPICPTKEAFDEFAETVFDGLMPPEQVEVFERHQPYNRRPDDVANDRLCILHKMWNADKHHAPMGVMGWAVAASAFGFGDLIGPRDFGFRVGPLGKNNEVGWVSADGAKRDLHPRVTIDIGFKTRRPTMAVPRHALIKMHQIVAEEVLPDLRPFLKT